LRLKRPPSGRTWAGWPTSGRPGGELRDASVKMGRQLNVIGIVVWFAGAVIGHDLLLMPPYTLADRSATAVRAVRGSNSD
jgi:hypothetical protein